MSRRVSNWESVLHKFIEKHRNTKFRWGHHDCMKFANKLIIELVGIDVIGSSKYNWKGKKDAFDMLERSPFDDCGDLCASEMNKHFKELSPLLAKRGDIVMIETDQGKGLGIVYGGHIVALHKEGIFKLSIDKAVRAWSIN